MIFQDLYEKNPGTFAKPVISGMLEFQWNEFLNARKRVSTLQSPTPRINSQLNCWLKSQYVNEQSMNRWHACEFQLWDGEMPQELWV